MVHFRPLMPPRHRSRPSQHACGLKLRRMRMLPLDPRFIRGLVWLDFDTRGWRSLHFQLQMRLRLGWRGELSSQRYLAPLFPQTSRQNGPLALDWRMLKSQSKRLPWCLLRGLGMRFRRHRLPFASQ